MPAHTPRDFAELAAHYASAPDVELPAPGKKGFGSATLRCKGKIFAMSPDGQSLVVKLPAARVLEVIAAGSAQPYSPGTGKVMKEWAAIAPAHGARWIELADEALAYSRRGGR